MVSKISTLKKKKKKQQQQQQKQQQQDRVGYINPLEF